MKTWCVVASFTPSPGAGFSVPALGMARQPPRRPLARPEQAEVLGVALVVFQVLAQRLLQHLPVDLAVGKGLRRNGFGRPGAPGRK